MPYPGEAVIQTFYEPGGHAGIVLTIWKNAGTIQSWQILQALTPQGAPPATPTLENLLQDQFLGTEETTHGVPLTVIYSSGTGDTEPLPPFSGGVAEYDGDVAGAEQIWKALTQGAETIDRWMPSYFIATQDCQTAVAFMDAFAGIPTYLPTNTTFNIVQPSLGFFLPIQPKNPLTGLPNPVQPIAVVLQLYSAAEEYLNDNNLHWVQDAYNYELDLFGNETESTSYSFAGPQNTVPVGGPVLYGGILPLFPQGAGSPLAVRAAANAGSDGPLVDLPSQELSFAENKQFIFLQAFITTVANYENVAPGDSGIEQDIISPLAGSAEPEAVGTINLFLQQQGDSQLTAVFGPGAGEATIDGTAGNELLVGLSGNNTLVAGANDELFAGVGANTYVFGAAAFTATKMTPATAARITTRHLYIQEVQLFRAVNIEVTGLGIT